MIYIALFTLVSIAIVSLVISIKTHTNTQTDLKALKGSFNTINLTAMNRLILRCLLNIANGYEPQNTIVLENRFDTYSVLFKERIEMLRQS
jgi:predicted acyltransferase (DUF342 family)